MGWPHDCWIKPNTYQTDGVGSWGQEIALFCRNMKPSSPYSVIGSVENPLAKWSSFAEPLSYVAQIRIRVSVSEGYGYADTAILKKNQYTDTFYYF